MLLGCDGNFDGNFYRHYGWYFDANFDDGFNGMTVSCILALYASIYITFNATNKRLPEVMSNIYQIAALFKRSYVGVYLRHISKCKMNYYISNK